MINIKDKNKAEILRSIYNNSIPVGLGFLHYDPSDMTIKEATDLINSGETCFDYIKGRCLKVKFKGDYLDEYAHDKIYGEGSAKACIMMVRDE